MGRKKGQQQRTKGNVLPSNSVRSADLLTKEGASAGLGLFQSLPSAALGNLPELAGLDSISNIEFRSVLKKLYKKDVTTKLKALTEMSELCGSAEQHEVLTVLPYWPRIYNRLFEDGERRVREGAQKAMQAIVPVVGKNLALQLKNLMGCWFISQCDPYAPAALTAESAISEAFSGEKKVAAFVFCRADILGCISAFLFSPLAKRDASSGEDANNYHRIVASCLEALSLFLKVVTKQNPNADEIENFLREARFWKFQKHSSPSVRGGFYNVIESLCLVSIGHVNNHISEVCRSVFHRLDEDNVTVCKPLYAAAVAVAAKCELWCKNIDIHKGLVAGLRNMLKAGCYGQGSCVMPTLLPILANVSRDLDIILIFSKVFEAMRQCINHDLIKQSKRGSELALASYIEIIKLAAKRVSNEVQDSETYEPFCQSLIREELIFVIRECWLEGCGKFVTAAALKFIPPVIIFLESQKLKGNPVYVTMCDIFWNDIKFVARNVSFMDKNVEPTNHIISFLSHLLNPTPLVATERSVRFSGDCRSETSTYSQNDERKNTKVLSFPTHDHTRRNINNILIFCSFLHPLKATDEMLRLQLEIFDKLGNCDLFSDILNRSGVISEQVQDDSVSLYIDTMLVPQVLKLVDQANCSDPVLQTLSGIIFHVVKHCDSSNYVPCDMSPFFDDNKPAYFEILLHFLLEMLRNINFKIGHWLHGLFNDDNAPNVQRVVEIVVKGASICYCSVSASEPAFDQRKSWEFLRLLLNSSYQRVTGHFLDICGPALYGQTLKNLAVMLDELKTCKRCYENAMNEFGGLMLSLVGRDVDYAILVNDSENLWHKLVTDLFQLHFVAEVPAVVLQQFVSLFSLAAQKEKPFVGCNEIVISSYVQSLAVWVQKQILGSTVGNLPNVLSSAKLLLTTVVEILHDSDSTLSLADHLLPSSEKWDEVRNFEVSSLKVDSIHRSILNASSVHPNDQIVSAFEELIHVLIATSDEYALGCSWTDCEKYIQMIEESILLAAVSVKSINREHNADTPYDVHKIFRTRILGKSLEYGGAWASTLSTLRDTFEEEDFQVVSGRFMSAMKKCEINLPLFQTMSFALDLLPDDELCEIVREMSNELSCLKPSDVSISDQYAFSFGVCAVCRISSEEGPSLRRTFHNLMVSWKKENVSLFLLDDCTDELEEETVVFNGCIATFFSELIKLSPESISEEDWDFIQCALLSWIEIIARSLYQENETNMRVFGLLRCSCSLLQVVNCFMSSPVAQEDPTVPKSLLSEWRGFFSSAINTPLFKIFIYLSPVDVPYLLLSDICECLRHVTPESIMSCVSDLKPKLTTSSVLPDDIQTIFNHLSCLMLSKGVETKQHLLVITTSYQFMVMMIDKLASPNSDLPPEEILNILHKISADVEVVFKIEDTVVAKSEGDSSDSEKDDPLCEQDTGIEHDYFKDVLEDNSALVILYLLTWKILIKLTKYISAEKKSSYVNKILKQNSPNLGEDLLPKLFRVMVGKKSHFRTDPDLFLKGVISLGDIEHVAASVYKDFLIEMPAASRVWYNELPKMVRSRVDKFTSVNVSPALIENEFKAVRTTAMQQNRDGMEINARPGAREVQAAYNLNELKMEIAVCLPPNHPLGPIIVNTERRAGVVMGQWRYWLLQITSFLQYQNGGIIDGLLMWKEKVDKKFEGMEECMICFSLVHGSSQNLPKLKCKTCKKKYHAQCLYKWFDTSNNSTCPLCRSPMIFR